jgi:hypothetical protein
MIELLSPSFLSRCSPSDDATCRNDSDPSGTRSDICEGATNGKNVKESNEENSPIFDRRVSPLVGAATQESNVWVLSVKGRKKEK